MLLSGSVESCVDQPPDLRTRTGGVDDSSRERPGAAGQIALRPDPLCGVSGMHSSVDQSRSLDTCIARDQPDIVALSRQATLYELDRFDDGGAGACGIRLSQRGDDSRPNGRVNDRLEVLQGRRVPEHLSPKGGAVELTVAPEECRPKMGDDRIERGLAPSEDFTRHPVGVDDDDTWAFTQPA